MPCPYEAPEKVTSCHISSYFMPTLDDIRSATTPIAVERGVIKFTLNAALEKLAEDENEAKEGGEKSPYKAMLEHDMELAIEKLGLDQQMASVNAQWPVLSDLEVVRELMARHKTGLGTGEVGNVAANLSAKQNKVLDEARLSFSDEEVQADQEKRLGEAETKLNELRVSYETNTRHRKGNTAARLAYLVPSTDIVDGQGEPCPVTPEFFRENFTLLTLTHCLEEVEAAVYGPFVTRA